MKYRSFLIKYAEIGVKGKNRYLFEDALVKHIHHRLKNLEGKFEVKRKPEESMRRHLKISITMK